MRSSPRMKPTGSPNSSERRDRPEDDRHVTDLNGAQSTAADLLQRATRRLDAAGIGTARLDAILLLAAATGIDADRLRLDPGRTVPGDAATRFETLLARRAAREPVARILGRRGFWTLDLLLSPDTLDPRPDSETLVEAVLEAVPHRDAPLRLLDLGTGSGALLLALLSELPNASGTGLDIAPGAAATAAENASRCGLADRARFVVGHWSACIVGPFDVIVSNPPYLTPAEIDAADPEVRTHDPRRALDGGPDGLDAYRAIIADLRRIVAAPVPGDVGDDPSDAMLVALEIGATQAQAVGSLLAATGARDIAVLADLAGRPRCVRCRIRASERAMPNPRNP